MRDIITNPPSNPFFLFHVHFIIPPLLVVHPNIILVNANLVIKTPLLNDTTTLLTVLHLNHVMIASVLDRIQTQKTTLIFNVNPLLI